jgi:hypothetical protein
LPPGILARALFSGIIERAWCSPRLTATDPLARQVALRSRPFPHTPPSLECVFSIRCIETFEQDLDEF